MPAHRAQGGLSLSGGKLASSDLQRAKELFKELLSKSFVFPFIPYYFVLIFSLLSQVQTALRLLSGVTSEWAERNEKIWWQKIPLPLMKWQNKASKSSWCILNSTQMCIKAHVEDAKKLPKNRYIFNLCPGISFCKLLQTLHRLQLTARCFEQSLERCCWRDVDLRLCTYVSRKVL